MAVLLVLSSACGSPLADLHYFRRRLNHLSIRCTKASVAKQGSTHEPWRSFNSGSGRRTSPSSSTNRCKAQNSGTDQGPPAQKGSELTEGSRVGAGSAAGSSATRSRVGAGSAAGSSATSLLSFLCPLLKFFGGGDPSLERNEFLEVATSSLSSLSRLPWGSKSLTNSIEYAATPQACLQIYEFEACPFCRRVREAMTELDLTVEIYPCPKGSLRHRELVRSIGGKEQFPFLVDLNTGVSMYESSDIVKYLFRQYGQGRNPSFGLLESTIFTGWVPTLLRAGRGMTLWESAGRVPSKKLELFSYENNPYSRIVREALCELELPYILHNVGVGSAKSKLLLEASGSHAVPYLVDPNTGIQMGDYRQIVSYLFKTYSSS